MENSKSSLDRAAVVLMKKRIAELTFDNNIRAIIFSWCALHERSAQLKIQPFLDGIVTENIQIARPFGEPSHSRQGVLERILSLPKDSLHAHHVQKVEVRRTNNSQKGKFRVEMLYQAVDPLTGNVINGVMGYDAKLEPHNVADPSVLARISEIKVSLIDRLGTKNFEGSFCTNRASSLIYYWTYLLQQNQKEHVEKVFDPNQREIQNNSKLDSFSGHWNWWKELEGTFSLLSYTPSNIRVNFKEGKEDAYEAYFNVHMEGLNLDKKPQETIVQVYWVLHEDYDRWPKIRVSRNMVKSLSSMDLELSNGHKRKIDELPIVVSDDGKVQRSMAV